MNDLTGGMERHHDGSFTVYGSYTNKQGQFLYHKRFYDYSIKDARAIARAEIKQLSTIN
jgi:hypothetical protein